MKQAGLRFGMLLALAVTASWARAQDALNVIIDSESENTQAVLSHMDAAAEAVFSKLLDIPRFLEYKPFAMLLTNTSKQAIVLVTIRWSGTSDGKIIVHDYSSHSLMKGLPAGTGSGSMLMSDRTVEYGGGHVAADGPVVLSPGERMIVAPGLMAREEAILKRGTASGGWSSSYARLQSAAGLTASLDTVVLEDGSVYGRDASHTINGLQANKAAMDYVALYVRTAEQRGMDGAEALRLLANLPTPRSYSPEQLQQSRIARMLTASRNWKELLAKMEAYRLPAFHRK